VTLPRIPRRGSSGKRCLIARRAVSRDQAIDPNLPAGARQPVVWEPPCWVSSSDEHRHFRRLRQEDASVDGKTTLLDVLRGEATRDQLEPDAPPRVALEYVPRRPLRVEEAARWLGVCPQTVRNLFREGRLPGYYVGRKILVYADAVEQFKAANAGPPPRTPLEETPLPEPEGRKPDVSRQPSRTRRGVRAFDRHSRR
jgi:excisionase family DNA binding protein